MKQRVTIVQTLCNDCKKICYCLIRVDTNLKQFVTLIKLLQFCFGFFPCIEYKLTWNNVKPLYKHYATISKRFATNWSDIATIGSEYESMSSNGYFSLSTPTMIHRLQLNSCVLESWCISQTAIRMIFYEGSLIWQD